MSYKRKLYEAITSLVVKFFQRANLYNVSLYERCRPKRSIETNYGVLKLFCPNELTLWRAKTFFTKEPETLKWIDSFKSDAIFYDIGANVGLYSLYAAAKGITTHAFEPEAQNYALLNFNIFSNNLNNRIDAHNLALNNVSKFSCLNINDYVIGGALNSFDKEIDYNYQPKEPVYRQSVVGFTLDDLISRHGFPIPTYMKIDVDGIEREIIDGSSWLLKQTQLKSILIELNEKIEGHVQIIEILENLGFKLHEKTRSSIVADSPDFKHLYNCIFIRE